MERSAIDRGLREQHKEISREGYDGHNRRSGLVDMRAFNIRKVRRIWNLRMRALKKDWNTPPSKKIDSSAV